MIRFGFLLQMTMVVNYNMPVDPIGEPDFETYRRRAHHTGWLDGSGIVVNLIDSPQSMETMSRIGGILSINMKPLDIKDFDALNNL